MRLVELFDKTGKILWDNQAKSFATAELSVGEYMYYLKIEQDDLDLAVSAITHHDSFAMIPAWLEELANDYSLATYSVEFEFEDRQGVSKAENEYGITGTGQQYKVFATVMKAMKEYAQNFDVDYWVFSATEPSRQKLYSKMAQRFARGAAHEFSVAGERFYVVAAS